MSIRIYNQVVGEKFIGNETYQTITREQIVPTSSNSDFADDLMDECRKNWCLEDVAGFEGELYGHGLISILKKYSLNSIQQLDDEDYYIVSISW
jgi:hypothetical protein